MGATPFGGDCFSTKWPSVAHRIAFLEGSMLGKPTADLVTTMLIKLYRQRFAHQSQVFARS
jgi:hypothetical protein